MPHDQPPKEGNFRPILESIARVKGSLTAVFGDFACMAACAYALQTREEEYLDVAKRYERKELNQFAKAMGFMVNEMEAHPFTDLLGPYFCEVQSKFSRDAGGEFYTPQEVGRAMAKMSIDSDAVIEAAKPVTINDPAAGSAGLILSLAEEFAKAGAIDLMRVTCQDISKVACDMAYINTTLWGIPTQIIWGDTLRNSRHKVWENIHWHRVGEPLREQAQTLKRLLTEPPPKAEALPEPDKTSEPKRPLSNQVIQQEWKFD